MSIRKKHPLCLPEAPGITKCLLMATKTNYCGKKDEEPRNHSQDVTAVCTGAQKESCPQHQPREAALGMFRAVLPFYPLRKAKVSQQPENQGTKV